MFLAALVVCLLLAAALDIGMEGANLHPTPRINSLTVGLGLVPVLELSLIALVWLTWRDTRTIARAGRVLATLGLLAVGFAAAGVAFFLAFFVG